ncbi:MULTISPECIES: radical SAM protein [Methylocystis]|uniref:radical SAM/SPASM domain-containing protein n=1 Tax=Methylocystis TaxID=133 RepID=UPI0024B954D3|nr:MULTISPECIES: radical SAM protein [Methylocystis]MDJ0450946.1 SPASM domain-containing protein [Methylocystis sp. JR02]
MGQASRLTLNPRVSVFKHNDGIYLFDPATRTCASMNEGMLAFLKNQEDADPFEELPDKDCNRLSGIAEKLRGLGILIELKDANKIQRPSAPDNSGSTTHLAIFVTTKCNLRCAYCYARGGDAAKTISREIWNLAMDNFFSSLSSGTAKGRADIRNVHLTIHGGGEPTIEFATLKEIVAEFCERSRSARLQPVVGMGTNGTYRDSVHRWIVNNNINVNISLDGPRDIQNRLRPFRGGRPSYDVVTRNLKMLVKAGRRVSVRATITDNALETMEETVELAKQLGLAAVHFEPVSLTGRCATSSLSRPDADEFAEKFLKCFLQGLKHDISVKYSGIHCFERYRQRFCAACGQNRCITPDGNITTCYEVLDPMDAAAGEFFIGKVDPIEGRIILNHAQIEQLRLRVSGNMEACKGCFLRYQCAGDCPVRSFRFSEGDLYSPDPYRCQIAHRINKQLIAWLADGIIEPRNLEHANIISFGC